MTRVKTKLILTLAFLQIFSTVIEGIYIPPVYENPLSVKYYSPNAHISLDKPVYKNNDVMFIEVHVIDSLTK